MLKSLKQWLKQFSPARIAKRRAQRKVQDAWIAALESGEYKQGRGALYNADSDSYCCLGVLARMSLDTGVAEEDVLDWGVLDENTVEWAGLRSAAGVVVGVNLLALNDTIRKSFPEIAAIIRAHRKELFL